MAPRRTARGVSRPRGSDVKSPPLRAVGGASSLARARAAAPSPPLPSPPRAGLQRASLRRRGPLWVGGGGKGEGGKRRGRQAVGFRAGRRPLRDSFLSSTLRVGCPGDLFHTSSPFSPPPAYTGWDRPAETKGYLSVGTDVAAQREVGRPWRGGGLFRDWEWEWEGESRRFLFKLPEPLSWFGLGCARSHQAARTGGRSAHV